MLKRYKTFSAVVLYCLFVVFLLVGCSNQPREVLGPGYTINMLNPHNNDRLLFSIYDGVLVYDFSNDYS